MTTFALKSVFAPISAIALLMALSLPSLSAESGVTNSTRQSVRCVKGNIKSISSTDYVEKGGRLSVSGAGKVDHGYFNTYDQAGVFYGGFQAAAGGGTIEAASFKLHQTNNTVENQHYTGRDTESSITVSAFSN